MTLRIGSVPYLNARPLIHGLSDVELIVPSRLAEQMARGEIDVGLVPVAEVLAHDQYAIVDDIAIASHGPVRSVFLAHRVRLDQVRRVAVDTASRTSAWLVRVILKYRYQMEPEFYPLPPGATLDDHEAIMLIGDEAILYALDNGDQPLLDLGESWGELTGLPFVYAVWAVRRAVVDNARIGNDPLGAALRRAKDNGLEHLEEVVQGSTEGTPEFRREYLTRHVQFDLGPAEKKGIERFQRYLQEMGLIETCHELRYIH